MAHGFEIAQRGVSIDKAAEWQKVASSKWAYLPIKAQGYFSVPDQNFGDSAVLFEHNLGYFSPFLIFIRERGGWTLNNNTYIFNNRTKLFAANATAFECYFILFDYNLDQPPPVDLGMSGPASQSAKNDEGVKALDVTGFVQPNTIESNDYRKYSFNTGAKAMAVHMNGKQTVVITDPEYIIRIPHNLGYLSTYMFFQYNSASFQPPTNDSISIAQNIVKDDTKTLSIQGAQAILLGTYYWLILKEPFALSI